MPKSRRIVGSPVVFSPRVLALSILAAVLALSGCRTVSFYEKERLGDAAMVFEDDPTEAHFHQKVFQSMEGSAGGIGESAGGGCGCY